MASKENQTYQIIVVSLVILVIALGVGLVLVNKQREADAARAASATQEAQGNRESERKAQDEMSQYKLWMGFPEVDNFDTLKATFDKDMETIGSTFDENSRSYREILNSFYTENQRLAAGESAAKQEIKDLKQRLLALEAEKNAQIAKFEEEAKLANSKRAEADGDYSERANRINQEKQDIFNRMEEKQNEIDEITAKNTADQIALNDKISKLERATEILQSNTVDPDPFAQPADGLIRWVNQRNGTVWINIGEADDLRPQVTFSVYDADENDALGAERKGSIEVTRILSAHMAEARITEDFAARPLLAGDKIYSQVWNRGRQVGFAITGVIDFDDDGSSDLEELKQIIAINNGKVDAVPNKDGTIEGQMTVDTRYLILGKLPEASRQAGLQTAWSTMSGEADTLGVETITLNEFLSLMGWKPERNTVQLGSKANASDFQAPPSEQKVPSTVPKKNNLFRLRRPPTSN